jgi:Lrp/AsnC family leucine-responsive transcriptional regulator
MRTLKEASRVLDKLDRHILRILQQDGRISMKELGEGWGCR